MVTIDWIGIEPFYTDSTPAVIVVVDRKNVDSLSFRLVSDGRVVDPNLGKLSITLE